MNTAQAVRLIALLEEIADQQQSELLNGSIAHVLEHVRPSIPADQLDSYDRFSARSDYQAFFQRMDACREALEESD